MLRDEAYVPFDIDFSEEDGTSKVITGPNMAGQSSPFHHLKPAQLNQARALVSERP